MLGLLMLVPVVTSLVLGLLYLFMGEAGPGLKAVGCVLFFAAVLLQFRSPYPLAGLILQVGVAVTLAVWRKLDTSL
jgi:chromate transport protein ChrA